MKMKSFKCIPTQYDLKNKVQKQGKSFLFSILRLVMLISIGYIILYPLLQMISTSLKNNIAFFDSSRVWIPSGFNIGFNYSIAFDTIKYLDGIKSTFVNEIIAALLEVVTCSVIGYGFARYKFKFKKVLIVCLFLTILIPEAMIIIPRVANYSHLDFLGILSLLNKLTGVDLRLNIIGSPLAFWLPSLFASGLRSGILIYIYIQFFKSLPYELEDAAFVDGAGPYRTFISIALPSSSVVFTTVLVFSIIWHWNDTLLGFMYMDNHYPLACNLSNIVESLTSRGFYITTEVEAQPIMMAACVMSLIPPLLFYMILQRRFIESIDRVGITG